MVNVLTDLHNGSLYNSLHLLFEKRLGFNLYRPIGEQWFHEGYFKIAEPYGNYPGTISQYLAINDRPYDPYTNLNGDLVESDGIYKIFSPEGNFEHKAITFDTFKNMKFDYIVGSHPLHECWEGLLQYQPTPKFIMQLGNENQTTNTQNVLSSVWAMSPRLGQNVCYYHQEFDLNEFTYEPPDNHTLIRSFVHLHPEKETFDIYKSNLPEFQMEAYGMGTDLGPSQNIAKQMKESAFGWHIKPADGYGHILHNWYACGRPVIIRGDYYAGKTGGMLLEDGKTCIDLDKHNFTENLNMIRYWSLPDHHKEMCKNAHDIFMKVCDFNSEAENIKTFLSNIL